MFVFIGFQTTIHTYRIPTHQLQIATLINLGVADRYTNLGVADCYINLGVADCYINLGVADCYINLGVADF